MKLKSSNKGTFIWLSGLVILIILLLSFKTIGEKPTKYLNAPEGIEQKTTLDFIQLTFNEKSYAKLKKKRDKALIIGILEANDTDYVPATVTFNGAEYRAEVRLKGDWTDHLKGDKWSFRIKLKDDETIMGMRKFSIHRPGSRGYINEWLYHKAIKKEDLIGLRYDFLEAAIHIKQNNSNTYTTKEVGIYAIEESFDKRTIESNKRKESIILKFSEDGYWAAVKKNKEIGSPSGIVWHKFMDYKVDYPITVFGEDKVLADTTLNNYFKTGKSLLEQLRSKKTNINTAFDVKELALQNAILNLFGATHGIPLINVRFYYNPITSKLEPIAFDGNSGAKLENYRHFFFTNQKRDSVYLKELAYAINRVMQPDYLDGLLKENSKKLSYYESILKTEYKDRLFKPENFILNQNVLKDELIRLKNKYKLNDITINTQEQVGKGVEIISNPKLTAWKKRGVILHEPSKNYLGNAVYKIERESITKAAYVIITDINVEPEQIYQTSILVKKGTVGHHFGLRIQGQYPNRVDAVFDLSQGGELKGGSKEGEFNYEGATIESLKNGWFKISLKAKVNVDVIKIVFGPTNPNKPILNWESVTKNKPNSYIDVSSVEIEKFD